MDYRTDDPERRASFDAGNPDKVWDSVTQQWVPLPSGGGSGGGGEDLPAMNPSWVNKNSYLSGTFNPNAPPKYRDLSWKEMPASAQYVAPAAPAENKNLAHWIRACFSLSTAGWARIGSIDPSWTNVPPDLSGATTVIVHYIKLGTSGARGYTSEGTITDYDTGRMVYFKMNSASGTDPAPVITFFPVGGGGGGSAALQISSLDKYLVEITDQPSASALALSWAGSPSTARFAWLSDERLDAVTAFTQWQNGWYNWQVNNHAGPLCVWALNGDGSSWVKIADLGDLSAETVYTLSFNDYSVSWDWAALNTWWAANHGPDLYIGIGPDTFSGNFGDFIYTASGRSDGIDIDATVRYSGAQTGIKDDIRFKSNIQLYPDTSGPVHISPKGEAGIEVRDKTGNSESLHITDFNAHYEAEMTGSQYAAWKQANPNGWLAIPDKVSVFTINIDDDTTDFRINEWLCSTARVLELFNSSGAARTVNISWNNPALNLYNITLQPNEGKLVIGSYTHWLDTESMIGRPFVFNAPAGTSEDNPCWVNIANMWDGYGGSRFYFASTSVFIPDDPVAVPRCGEEKKESIAKWSTSNMFDAAASQGGMPGGMALVSSHTVSLESSDILANHCEFFYGNTYKPGSSISGPSWWVKITRPGQFIYSLTDLGSFAKAYLRLLVQPPDPASPSTPPAWSGSAPNEYGKYNIRRYDYWQNDKYHVDVKLNNIGMPMVGVHLVLDNPAQVAPGGYWEVIVFDDLSGAIPPDDDFHSRIRVCGFPAGMSGPLPDGQMITGPALIVIDYRSMNPDPDAHILVNNGAAQFNAPANGFDLQCSENSRVVNILNFSAFMQDASFRAVRFIDERVAFLQRGKLSDLETHDIMSIVRAISEVFNDANIFTPIDAIIDALPVGTAWHHANFAYKLTEGWTIPPGAYYEETWHKEDGSFALKIVMDGAADKFYFEDESGNQTVIYEGGHSFSGRYYYLKVPPEETWYTAAKSGSWAGRANAVSACTRMNLGALARMVGSFLDLSPAYDQTVIGEIVKLRNKVPDPADAAGDYLLQCAVDAAGNKTYQWNSGSAWDFSRVPMMAGGIANFTPTNKTYWPANATVTSSSPLVGPWFSFAVPVYLTLSLYSNVAGNGIGYAFDVENIRTGNIADPYSVGVMDGASGVFNRGQGMLLPANVRARIRVFCTASGSVSWGPANSNGGLLLVSGVSEVPLGA